MEPGQIIDRRYRIDFHADEGGMGTVFKGFDLSTSEHVAIKVLRGDVEVERFEREAVVLAELAHPGIVRYRANGVSADGERYLIMEWVEGETLSQRMSTLGVNTHEALAIARRMAEALDTMHWRGVVHRDLKPKNLILMEGRPDLVKIIDFGIARHSQEITSLTKTGVMVGSLSYMAPEQARGSREIDGRLDIFGLGCVLYECLTGRVPFSGADALAVRAKILLADPPPIQLFNPDASGALSDLVARLLEKQPERRPQAAGQVAHLLGALTEKPGARHPRGHRPVQTTETRSLPEESPSPTPMPHDAPSIVCMVLLGTAEDELSGDALLELQSDRRERITHALPPGSQFEVLDDGWSIVTLGGAGSTHDQTTRAARLALKLRENFPDVPMAIAAQRSPDRDLEELIDRGAQTVVRESLESILADASQHPGAGAIRVDDVTVKLLPAQFQVVRVPSGYYLTGELAHAHKS